MRNGGWLHVSPKPMPVVSKSHETPPLVGASRMILRWAEETHQNALQSLATRLGLSSDSLASLNAVYASQHRAWAFPMRDGFGEVVGIRLRAEDGRKWAVRGSKQGIFWPVTDPQPTCFIPEGPTDTAAALCLGLFAVGRPSCSCGGREIRQALRGLNIRRAVIVADNDEPGIQGARRVAKELRGIKVAIWTPPAKDLREFVRCGGTASLVNTLTKDLLWLG